MKPVSIASNSRSLRTDLRGSFFTCVSIARVRQKNDAPRDFPVFTRPSFELSSYHFPALNLSSVLAEIMLAQAGQRNND
jgi:hypothetical protein